MALSQCLRTIAAFGSQSAFFFLSRNFKCFLSARPPLYKSSPCFGGKHLLDLHRVAENASQDAAGVWEAGAGWGAGGGWGSAGQQGL